MIAPKPLASRLRDWPVKRETAIEAAHEIERLQKMEQDEIQEPYVNPMESMLGRPYGQEKKDVTCVGAPCSWPTCDCGR